MPGPKSPLVITLTGEEEYALEKLTRSTKEGAGRVKRARIVLLLARGHSVSQTARLVADQRRIVREWGRRFMEKRIDGLFDKPRPGRRPVFSPRGGDGAGSDRLPDARPGGKIAEPLGLHGIGARVGA